MIPQIVHCSSCHAPMRWAYSPNGARLPLNAAPIAVASAPPRAVRYTLDVTVRPWRAVVAPEDAQFVYTSHFTSCPKAASFSRRRISTKGPSNV